MAAIGASRKASEQKVPQTTQQQATASDLGRAKSLKPYTTDVHGLQLMATAPPTGESNSGLFSGITRSSSLVTGVGSPHERSLWSAYSSMVLHLNSTCFVSAADVACCLATVLVVGVLIVALAVLTDRGSQDTRHRQTEVVIRGPFGVLRGLALPVRGGDYAYTFLGVPFAPPMIDTMRFRPSRLQAFGKSPNTTTSKANLPVS
ncbi:hypothetical protein HPB50_002968 [Hyalomma asiaticum]|uniref:Uncharacterized protein n=1 Tax=Hyalomma asiaticum TaxID=266040 RepID=A0ACB7SQR9_HYAAI|nr:hypothetical protein HPB50_002968 [Hyalomma asiaticum]